MNKVKISDIKWDIDQLRVTFFLNEPLENLSDLGLLKKITGQDITGSFNEKSIYTEFIENNDFNSTIRIKGNSFHYILDYKETVRKNKDEILKLLNLQVEEIASFLSNNSYKIIRLAIACTLIDLESSDENKGEIFNLIPSLSLNFNAFDEFNLKFNKVVKMNEIDVNRVVKIRFVDRLEFSRSVLDNIATPMQIIKKVPVLELDINTSIESKEFIKSTYSDVYNFLINHLNMILEFGLRDE